MTHEEIIRSTEEFVKKEIKHADTAHDWWHIERVRNNARLILKNEKADALVVELAALLHDVTDIKVTSADENSQTQKLTTFLNALSISPEQKENILDSIAKQSFRKSLDGELDLSIEGRILQDADRLDAIGALGIARVFAYGGKKGRPLHDPTDPPQSFTSSEEYKESGSTTAVNHFYEKLLKLKDLMNTDTAKKIAQQRHEFMQVYLDHFFTEWQGKSHEE